MIPAYAVHDARPTNDVPPELGSAPHAAVEDDKARSEDAAVDPGTTVVASRAPNGMPGPISSTPKANPISSESTAAVNMMVVRVRRSPAGRLRKRRDTATPPLG